MEELEAVLHAVRLEQVEAAQDLGDGETELRAVAARRLPAAHAARRQFHAHADARPHADLLGVLQDELEFGVLLDDRDDVAADLLRPHRQLDELGVLEAVAHDRRVVAGHGGHGHQLGLGAGFEAEAVLAAELHDFLHDLALLVDLDRVDADVLAAVLVGRDGLLERRVDLAQAVLEDAGEAHQNGRAQTPQVEPIDQFLEVDRAGGIAARMHLHVPGLVHREVALAPAGHVVVFRRLGRRPVSIGRRGRGALLFVGSRAHLGTKRINEIPGCARPIRA